MMAATPRISRAFEPRETSAAGRGSTDQWRGPPQWACESEADRSPAVRGSAGRSKDTSEVAALGGIGGNGEEDLYDHKGDPNEWTNLAGKPEMAGVAAKLRKELTDIVSATKASNG